MMTHESAIPSATRRSRMLGLRIRTLLRHPEWARKRESTRLFVVLQQPEDYDARLAPYLGRAI